MQGKKLAVKLLKFNLFSELTSYFKKCAIALFKKRCEGKGSKGTPRAPPLNQPHQWQHRWRMCTDQWLRVLSPTFWRKKRASRPSGNVGYRAGCSTTSTVMGVRGRGGAPALQQGGPRNRRSPQRASSLAGPVKHPKYTDLIAQEPRPHFPSKALRISKNKPNSDICSIRDTCSLNQR